MKKNIAFMIGAVFVLWLLLFINAYPVDKAARNGDYITYPEQINRSRFDEFMTSINNQTDTQLRITEYSKEGKPQINDITYRDQVIYLHAFYPERIFNRKRESGEYDKIWFDNAGSSKDMYVVNTKSGVKTYVCQITD